MAPPVQTQNWTKEDIVETVTLLARKRHQMSLAEFVAAMNKGKLDPCDDGDLIALVRMLPEGYELVEA